MSKMAAVINKNMWQESEVMNPRPHVLVQLWSWYRSSSRTRCEQIYQTCACPSLLSPQNYSRVTWVLLDFEALRQGSPVLKLLFGISQLKGVVPEQLAIVAPPPCTHHLIKTPIRWHLNRRGFIFICLSCTFQADSTVCIYTTRCHQDQVPRPMTKKRKC